MPTTICIQLSAAGAWQAGEPEAASDGVLLLRVLALMEAAPPHLDDEDGPDALRWQALEARVDLTLQLLGQLLARGVPRPPVCSFQLSGETASWSMPAPPPLGEAGTLALYLSSRIPQPLQLPATVIAVEPMADGARVTVTFNRLEPELQDWLDKTIFRRHRREIFERKHSHDE
ncbi:PilZ domain-containing protein [Chitinimonas viridis]|uniref:PilZ domain-containing protein n=1 Tax=Chitinimonas viridis TaxID=664880 RepID=A0ABT8B169_9NEIS|nr:PilZ domain-containing protein [Chitinimonas viridis]MDN3575978.1 PilZ domain-containing protein [Chitinimonas viridis]